MERYKYPSVLTIAGSDSGGGAGIQADLKTISALGCYGTSAITAITVQNTMGVSAIHHIPPGIVSGQIKAVLQDIVPSAIKIGMVPDVEIARAIAQAIVPYRNIPVIFDPVMVAGSGHQLIDYQTIEVFRELLFPVTKLLTPNIDEAELLLKSKITTVNEMITAAKTLLETGSEAVLLKGGHLEGKNLYDVYVHQNGEETVFEAEHIESNNLHGTGCTLSSAIAAFLSLNFSLENSIIKARAFVWQAILNGSAVKTGNGHGPLNHFFDPQKLQQHLISSNE